MPKPTTRAATDESADGTGKTEDDHPLARPTRSRRAPSRYVPSRPPRRPRRSGVEAGVDEAGEKLARQARQCSEEEEYVRGYSCSHVGQIGGQMSAELWVEVDGPPLGGVKGRVSEDTLTRNQHQSTLALVQPTNEERHAKDANAPPALASNDSARCEKGSREKGLLEEHNVMGDGQPNAREVDELNAREVDEELSGQDIVLHDTTPNFPQGAALANGEERADDEFAPAVLSPAIGSAEAVVASQDVEALTHAPSLSSSPAMFLDAMEEPSELARGKERTVTREVESAKATQAYHPETALSHGKSERSKRTHASHSLQPKKKEEKMERPILFFGSDDDGNGDPEATTLHALPSQARNEQPDRPDSHKSRSSLDRPQASVEAGPSRAEKNLPTQRHSEAKLQGLLEARRKRKRSKKRQDEEMKSRRTEATFPDEDLSLDLNIDAFARSTSNRVRDAQRLRVLQRLQKSKARAVKRRRGEASSSSESSSSSSGTSAQEDTDDISKDSDDFIVEDDGEPEQRRNAAGSKKQVARPRRHKSLSPPSFVSRDHLTNVRAMSRRERLQEYVRWIVVYAAELPVDPNRVKQLEAVRTNLREKFRMEFNSLTSQTNRKQFTWYLKHFPYFERRPMIRDEKEQHRGCSACHRVQQVCESAYSCWGYLYNEQTLEKNAGHVSSDMSTEAEDWKHTSANEKGDSLFTFYLGESCAKHASVKHKLYHWERRLLTEVLKLPAYKVVSRKEPDRVAMRDIEAVVDAYYPRLSVRFSKLETDAANLRTNPDRLFRMRERWDDEP